MSGTSIPFFLYRTGAVPPAPGGITLVLASSEAPDVAGFGAHVTLGGAIFSLAAGEPVDVCSIIAFNSTPFMKEVWVQVPPKASGGWVEDQE